VPYLVNIFVSFAVFRQRNDNKFRLRLAVGQKLLFKARFEIIIDGFCCVNKTHFETFLLPVDLTICYELLNYGTLINWPLSTLSINILSVFQITTTMYFHGHFG
jgi:hypothetical protein